MKIEIKSITTGSVLFDTDVNCNTIKYTLLEAIKSGAYLSGANLSYADLSGANLIGANLHRSNLIYANLIGANLRKSDLSGVNLSYANLNGAKTDNRFIQISCIGSRKRSTTYCFEINKIWSGCFCGTLEEFEERVNKTHANNPQYLKEYTLFINYIKSLK